MLIAAIVWVQSSAPIAAQEAAAAAAFKPEEIDQIVAPIALYPDPLLAQVFMASTYPLEIVQAARWVKDNPKLKDTSLQDALQKQTWDPSVKSLAAFPQVLTMMNDQLDWTQKLGDAFLAQQKDVMAGVQRLRAKAQGPDAPGGAYDYVVRGTMIGGFALVAYPAQFGNSGVMTFIVNHDGVVFQKDLGPNDAAAARTMKTFNPDPSWKRVEDAGHGGPE